MHDTRQQLLRHLQTSGATAVVDLARSVRLEPVTVRHHLGLLRGQGLVESEAQRRGRGRPRKLYRLSDAGRALLCQDAGERLAGRLLDWLGAQDPAAVETFLAATAREVAERPCGCAAASTAPEALDHLVTCLAAEGLDARWERDDAGLVLHQGTCPYPSLCQSHPAVCDLDLARIQALFPGGVVRESWRLSGDACCSYRLDAAVDLR